MNKIVNKIVLTRQDLSDYVFHFTCGSKAKETLQQILSDGAIKDIKSKGYICFTEAPVLMLPDMFDIFEQYQEPMYAPYGIGVHRDTFYQMGGRPVIYGTEDDKTGICEFLQWRFVMMKPDEYDFSWLREWRLPKSEYKINKEDIVVVKTLEDEKEILLDFDNMIIDAEPADGGHEIFYTGKFNRLYKGLSMEGVKNMRLDNKDKLRKDIAEQAATELIYLGSEWK